MIGTLVNAAAVIAGGTIGCLIKKGIKEDYIDSIYRVLGLAVLVIGINGVCTNMVSISDTGSLESNGELLLVVFLVVGTLIGEVLKLQQRFDKVSKKVETRFKKGGFASGFVNGTMLFCIGAMAIIGSINDGLSGDSRVLFVKSALDFTAAIIFGTTLGYGVIFACVPVFVYQGAITLLAGQLDTVLQGELLRQICFVGYGIIMAIGFNFILTKKFRTLNMVPSMLLPVIYHFINLLIQKFT